MPPTQISPKGSIPIIFMGRKNLQLKISEGGFTTLSTLCSQLMSSRRTKISSNLIHRALGGRTTLHPKKFISAKKHKKKFNQQREKRTTFNILKRCSSFWRSSTKIKWKTKIMKGKTIFYCLQLLSEGIEIPSSN